MNTIQNTASDADTTVGTGCRYNNFSTLFCFSNWCTQYSHVWVDAQNNEVVDLPGQFEKLLACSREKMRQRE